MSVEDYHKEMEMAIIRANIEEYPKATMTRFLGGLNRSPTWWNYNTIWRWKTWYMAIKIERQLKYKRQDTSYDTLTYSSEWPKKEENEGTNEKKEKSALLDTKGMIPN